MDSLLDEPIPFQSTEELKLFLEQVLNDKKAEILLILHPQITNNPTNEGNQSAVVPDNPNQ